MSESETAAAPAETPKPPPKPARELPSQEGIAAWIQGQDLPSLSALFQPMPVVKFDGLLLQIKKEELLPQHWQVISDHSVRGDFDALPEAGRLRVAYRDQELARRRLANLELAWREIAGKQPSLWTVSDLMVAIRRLIDKKVEVDFHELLAAQRDVWAGMTLPHGREQLEVLWATLSFIRKKTKK